MTKITQAYSNFFFPLLIEKFSHEKLTEKLLQSEFVLYDEQSSSQVNYGDDIQEDYHHLRDYFMPSIEERLFSNKGNGENFLRFTKNVETSYNIQFKERVHEFSVECLDIILCPFSIVFLVVRTKHSRNETTNNTEDFIHQFRSLEKERIFMTKDGEKIQCHSTETFIQTQLINNLPFLFRKNDNHHYSNSFANFQDKKMIVNNFITIEGEPSDKELFYLNEGHGTHDYNDALKPYISDEYIQEYLEKNSMNKYDENINFVQTEENGTITTFIPENNETWLFLKNYFNSALFYQLIIHYFKNITLLTLSSEYATIEWKKDQSYVRELMKKISLFDARYNDSEVSTFKEENEITTFLQDALNLDRKYDKTIHSLNQLFTNQEQIADLKQNNLLFFLTMSTVITGVFGMNLIIDQWKKGISINQIEGYTGIENFAFIVTAVSLIAAVVLTVQKFYEIFVDKWRKFQKDKMK